VNTSTNQVIPLRAEFYCHHRHSTSRCPEKERRGGGQRPRPALGWGHSACRRGYLAMNGDVSLALAADQRDVFPPFATQRVHVYRLLSGDRKPGKKRGGEGVRLWPFHRHPFDYQFQPPRPAHTANGQTPAEKLRRNLDMPRTTEVTTVWRFWNCIIIFYYYYCCCCFFVPSVV